MVLKKKMMKMMKMKIMNNDENLLNFEALYLGNYKSYDYEIFMTYSDR